MNPYQRKIYDIYKENGEKLPPFRQLAKIIGVSSLNTVSYHVNQLKKQGYFNLEKESNAVIKLNLKNLVSLENKKGVFVLLEGKTPFSVHSSENIKASLIEQISNTDSELVKKIKSDSEKINLAYYLIDDETEREDLKKHLVEFYKLNL